MRLNQFEGAQILEEKLISLEGVTFKGADVSSVQVRNSFGHLLEEICVAFIIVTTLTLAFSLMYAEYIDPNVPYLGYVEPPFPDTGLGTFFLSVIAYFFLKRKRENHAKRIHIRLVSGQRITKRFVRSDDARAAQKYLNSVMKYGDGYIADFGVIGYSYQRHWAWDGFQWAFWLSIFLSILIRNYRDGSSEEIMAAFLVGAVTTFLWIAKFGIPTEVRKQHWRDGDINSEVILIGGSEAEESGMEQSRNFRSAEYDFLKDLKRSDSVE